MQRPVEFVRFRVRPGESGGVARVRRQPDPKILSFGRSKTSSAALDPSLRHRVDRLVLRPKRFTGIARRLHDKTSVLQIHQAHNAAPSQVFPDAAESALELDLNALLGNSEPRRDFAGGKKLKLVKNNDITTTGW